MNRREAIQTQIECLSKKLVQVSTESLQAKQIQHQIGQLETILKFEDFGVADSENDMNLYWRNYQHFYQKQISKLFLQYLTKVVFPKVDSSALKIEFQAYLEYQRLRTKSVFNTKEEVLKLQLDPFLSEVIQRFNAIPKEELSTRMVDFIDKDLPFIQKIHLDALRLRPELLYNETILKETDSYLLLPIIARYNATLDFQIPNDIIPQTVSKTNNRTSKKINTNAYTLAQQYFAIYYLLYQLGLDFGMVAKTDIARFVRMLTNRELGKNIASGNIYKTVKKPFNKKDDKMVHDLKIILPFFQSLRLSGAIKRIQKDIESYNNA